MPIALPDWPRRFGSSLGSAHYRQRPEDFQVDEILGFEADGEGPHQLLWVEKAGVNTAFAAQALARHAGVAERDVGYAGLKDRHALTRQYFTVPGGDNRRWDDFSVPGIQVLSATAHRRKLRRGSHRGNRFRIVLRELSADRAAFEARITELAADGVPNYFGVQRFGKGGANLGLAAALVAGKRLPRHKRGFAISTLRAMVFNQLLAARLEAGSWNRALSGELLQLDGRGSWFRMEADDPEIASRLERLEIHPTGPLPGRARFPIEGEVAALEQGMLEAHADWQSCLERLAVEADRRALRLAVADLGEEWICENVVALSFELSSGGYATAVMRELVDLRDVHDQPEPEIE